MSKGYVHYVPCIGDPMTYAVWVPAGKTFEQVVQQRRTFVCNVVAAIIAAAVMCWLSL